MFPPFEDEIEIPKKIAEALTLESEQQQNQQKSYHLSSINTTISIRELTSQGLSFQLWPAASTLVNLLDSTNTKPSLFSRHVAPLRILELGSGTGFVGIAAAVLLKARVTVTDLPHVLPNLRFNVEVNAGVIGQHGGSVDVAALSWGDVGEMEAIGGREYDVILGSDVVYHDHLYEPLIETLKFLMLGSGDGEERGVVFVMAHLKRWKKESVFFKKAKKFFDVEVVHVDSPREGCRVGVNVYRFVRKSGKQVQVECS